MTARAVTTRRRRTALAALAAAGAVLCGGLATPAAGAAPPATAVSPAGGASIRVIVAAEDGRDSAARAAVTAVGGTVTRRLGLIGATAAVVPQAALARLQDDPAIAWVERDRKVTLLHDEAADPASGPTSLFHLAETVRAKQVRGAGATGAGVDVALLDSGVVPVDGLTSPGKVVNGPDLSFETGADEVRYLDTYGHGTHMAGIIAGRDDALESPVRQSSHGDVAGVAPDARIVNVKLADSSGATDVSQVIAGIDWVVQHGRRNGLDIRVLNLSFGTDGVQDYRVDPLAHAVEQAWRRGVVVVVAAGNTGHGDARLNAPAYDPYVIAVGASNSRGTVDPSDDVVAPFSSRGDEARRPDLVAPGTSIVSLRDPGSRLDQAHPGARVGTRLFRGSGTSQAAAVVSGAAALLLSQRPGLTPDQVKALLTSTARPLAAADPAGGAGLLDVAAAARAATPNATQDWPRSRGTGSLELARGSHHVAVDGVTVVGEQSVFLTAWSAHGWLTSLLTGGSWSGGSWSAKSWAGDSWTGGTWSGNTWSGNTWSGNTWSGNTWSGNTWSGNTWSGNTWSGNTWSGGSWSSAEW